MHVAFGRVRRKSRIGADDAGARAMNQGSAPRRVGHVRATLPSTTTNGEVIRF